MNTGMIIIGFPGIGKSSVANVRANEKYIDLESSNFNLEDGTKVENWVQVYTNIAFHLAQQGKVVFVSSHNDVHIAIMEKRVNNPELQEFPVMIIYPTLTIKDAWLTRLKNRLSSGLYKSTNSSEYKKNLAAYEAAEKFYETWVKAIDQRDYSNTDLYGKNVYAIELLSISYRLENVINNFTTIYSKVEESKDTYDRMLSVLKQKYNNNFCRY